jgi:hypothetical protein
MSQHLVRRVAAPERHAAPVAPSAPEARQAEREPKLRRRCVWWDTHRGEPRPVAEPGEELIVHRWMLPDEEPTPEAAGAGGAAAVPCARRPERQGRAIR